MKSLTFLLLLALSVSAFGADAQKFRRNIDIVTADPTIYFNGVEVAIGASQTTFSALTDNSGGATADGTIGAVTAPSTLTDSGGGAAANGTIELVTAPSAITDSSGASASTTLAASTGVMCAYMYYQNIAAAATTNAAAQKDLNGASSGYTMATLVQPSQPRNIVLTLTDANSSISSGTITVVGTAPDGTAVSELHTITGAGGTQTLTGTKVFATLTSITGTTIAGNGASDTLDAGWGAKIGLPLPAGSTSMSIVKLVAAGANEAASATDATNNSFTPTTAPDGSKDYEIWYTYVNAQSTLIRNAISSLAARQAEERTAIIALTDAIKEISTIQAVNKTAITALTDAVKELSTQSNTIRTKIRSAGIVQ